MDRAKEVAVLDDVLRRVRSGHGQALVLRGEPGIGKTVLLGHVAEAAEGMRLLRTGGVEPETEIGYAALHRLVLPVLGAVDQIPRPQAHALEIALGRAEGPVPDRFLVALATLSLLAEVAVDRPVLCLVDDAQWVDRASLDALAFVGRRLDAEPVGMVFASRPDAGAQRTLAGVSELWLTGLDERTAGALLDGHDRGRLTPAERRQMLALAGGNPLALRELPDALRQGGRALEPVPLTARLRDAFLHQVRRRDEATRRLLLVIAAEGSGQLAVVRAAAESMGATVDPLDEGTLDDLVAHEGERLTFRHPLIRAAVYHGASPGERRAAHRALAAALQRRQTSSTTCRDDPPAWRSPLKARTEVLGIPLRTGTRVKAATSAIFFGRQLLISCRPGFLRFRHDRDRRALPGSSGGLRRPPGDINHQRFVRVEQGWWTR